MNTKQKQWQLYLLGYLGDADEIDGIWGKKSIAATLKFQTDHFPEKCAWDGIFGPNTEEKSREIIANIQEVITHYVETPLVIDGLAGQKTSEAVMRYQESMELPVTCVVDRNTYEKILQWIQDQNHTNNFWEKIEYFTREEFMCKCGGKYCTGYPAEMQEQIVRICDAARKHFGRPGYVISGLRDPMHNVEVGGVPNSQHMHGEAVDLMIDGIDADELLAFIQTQPHRYAYKINETNVHVDIPKRNS